MPSPPPASQLVGSQPRPVSVPASCRSPCRSPKCIRIASGVLVAGLDLGHLSEHLSRLRQTGSPFLAGSVLTVADRDGVILARSPQHAEFVGKRFPPPAIGPGDGAAIRH